MELERAKEILSEVFHARPSEVEEMIQSRLEEKPGRRARGTEGDRRLSAGVNSSRMKISFHEVHIKQSSLHYQQYLDL
jgi:hypothetical protein